MERYEQVRRQAGAAVKGLIDQDISEQAAAAAKELGIKKQKYVAKKSRGAFLANQKTLGSILLSRNILGEYRIEIKFYEFCYQLKPHYPGGEERITVLRVLVDVEDNVSTSN